MTLLVIGIPLIAVIWNVWKKKTRGSVMLLVGYIGFLLLLTAFVAFVPIY